MRSRRAASKPFALNLEKLAPFLDGRSSEVTSFDDLRLLTVGVDRLTQWHKPGLLCIGDAAHTMSPVGGVGINLAIQDAVAAANILAPALRRGDLTEADLAKVQARREFPTRITQGLQVQIQKNVIQRVLQSQSSKDVEAALRAAFAEAGALARPFPCSLHRDRLPARAHRQTRDWAYSVIHKF